MGGNACRLSRSHPVVVLNGLCARRRTDAGTRVSWARCIEETAYDVHAAHGAHSGHGADLDLLNHPWLATAAVVVHTLGHLLVAGLVAMIVYEKLGVRILQRAWFNFDLAWAIALIVSGLVTALL